MTAKKMGRPPGTKWTRAERETRLPAIRRRARARKLADQVSWLDRRGLHDEADKLREEIAALTAEAASR